MNANSRPQSPLGLGMSLSAVLGRTAAPRSADDTVDIALIDEDPDQPRKIKDDDPEIAALAQSMLIVPPGGSEPVGVLQPVGIREAEAGRFRLVYGARRLRAAKLAGLTKIPVRFVRADQAGLAAQVIENQHRASLPNSSVARSINDLAAQGMPIDQITKAMNLSRDHVFGYRLVEKLCAPLLELLDRADILAIAKVHRAWEKATPEWRGAYEAEIRRFIDANPADTRFSQISAREIIDSATPAETAEITRNDCAAGTSEGLAPETDRNEDPELEKSTPATDPVTTGLEEAIPEEAEEPPIIPLKLPKKVQGRVQSTIGKIIDGLPASKRRWAWSLVQAELNLTAPEGDGR